MYRILILILLCMFGSCTANNDQIIAYNETLFNLDNGVLFYKNTAYSGIVTHYNEAFKIHTKTQYLDGKKHGSETKRYIDNTLAEERFYTYGHKSGIHRAWWKNGQLKFEYHFNPKGEYHGVVNSWYDNGQQTKAFHFVNGKEEGTQKMWQKNGKLKANFVTKNGERFGLIGLKKCYSVNTKNEEYN